MFCLPQELIDKFKAKLKSGEMTPEKLTDMTSEERHSFLSDFLGEQNATKANRLFESKLLLKDQQAGILHWAQKLAGLTPEAKRDIVSRVNRMTEVLEPKDLDSFLADLAEQKLGMRVTMEEAGKISELAKAVAEKRAAIDKGGSREEYGAAYVLFDNYIKDLKSESQNLTLKERIQPKNLGRNIKDLGGLAKSLKATLDDSAIFRQGWKTLWTNPLLWAKNAKQSFVDIARSMQGKDVLDGIKADIVSRENFDLMQKAKLAVGVTEEAFPTQLPEKIPWLGRVFKASENAYTGFLYRTRADVFDKYIDIAKKSGVDVTDKHQLESIGKLVNSLTGRGNLGPGEKVANVVNNVFFSPRSMKANIDTLTLHAFDSMSGFARKQAAINLLKVVAGTAGVLAVANAISPGSVEKDPRSSDFGKIKIGDTRFDVSGGMASIVTLAMRLLTHSSKSSTTGLIQELDTGKFGSQTSMDVISNFAMNKLSPLASVLKDLITKKDFQGNKPTVIGELENLLVPLPITNAIELQKNPNAANLLVGMIADSLGIVTNTYSATTNWETSSSAELQQFKEKVGQQEFNKANDKYNQRVQAWLRQKLADPSFKSLSDEEKQQKLSDERSAAKDQVFRDYGFVYHRKIKKK